MDQRRLEKFIEPHKKYNLKLKANTDFKLSTYPELSGKYIKEIPIPWIDYKWFYAPTSVVKIYFLTDQYIVPAVQNVYVPLGKVQKIILVRPDYLSSGDIYFQFWLLNTESVKILDIHEEKELILLKNGVSKICYIPFPTYQMKLYFYIPLNPTSIDFNITIQPINEDHDFILDELIGTTEKLINNVYKYDFIGGSGVVTNPHYPFPSYLTYVELKNNDVSDDILGCRLKVISFED